MKMENKLFVLLAVSCLFNVAIAYRLPRDAQEADTTASNTTSETDLRKQDFTTIMTLWNTNIGNNTSEEKLQRFFRFLSMLVLEVAYPSRIVEKSDFDSDTFHIHYPNRNPIEKLNREQLQEIRTELEKELPEEKVDEFISALQKYSDGRYPEKQVDGQYELFRLIAEKLGQLSVPESTTTEKT